MSSSDGALRRPLILTVVGAALIALASWGGTVAAWDDTQVRPLGQVQNGFLRLDAMADPVDSAFSGSSTIDVAFQTEVAPQDRPDVTLLGPVDVDAEASADGWDGGLAALVDVTHPSTVTSAFDVGVTGPQGNTLVLNHAGAAFTVDTTLTMTAPDVPTWSVEESVTTRYEVNFPSPDVRGDGSLPAVCQSTTLLSNATIRWSWANTDAATASPAVDTFELQARRVTNPPSAWTTVRTTMGQARSVGVPSGLLSVLGYYDVRVVALPKNPDLSPIPATFVVRVQITTLLGIPLAVRCHDLLTP